jgi:lipopolysaccharide transport system ATP-binding protein
MSDPVITVENLSKRYLVGHSSGEGGSDRYTALRDVLAREARNFARKAVDVFRGRQVVEGDEIEEFWALKNVSFEVERGEILGIIGRNGAGKSTLLKILSRVTEPTEGRVLLRGRVASLLEVGTGFHPELTGRENIFLNGAILGMTQREIRKKFDEIVAFAEVERFLDTPVKRYSSGMYVRLAFSIAAHLEPEILIVDEVLAVGDVNFQKKSLGKMHTVAAEENRTVLFVSHNLPAVQSMCDRAILVDSGAIVAQGAPRSVVKRYLAQAQSSSNGERLWSRDTAPGNESVALMAVRVFSSEGEPSGTLDSDQDVYVELDFIAKGEIHNLCVGFDLTNSEGVTLVRTYQTDLAPERWVPLQSGWNRWRCKIPKGLLNHGDFLVSPRIGIFNVSWIVYEDAVLQFRVNLRHGVSPLWHALSEANHPGLIAPILDWSESQLASQIGCGSLVANSMTVGVRSLG